MNGKMARPNCERAENLGLFEVLPWDQKRDLWAGVPELLDNTKIIFQTLLWSKRCHIIKITQYAM